MTLKVTVVYEAETGVITTSTFSAHTVKNAYTKAIDNALNFGDYHTEADTWKTISVTIERDKGD